MRGRKPARGHISAEVLLDYLEERADEETAAQVRAHVETGCQRCAAELAAWRRVLVTLHSSAADAPPEEVIERAIDIFERRSDNRTVLKPAWAERPALRAPAALAAMATSFQMLFQAAGTDIDLLCEREGSDWRIMGQALSLGGPEAGWTVAAYGADGRMVTQTNALGEFRFASLGPRDYELSLHGADRRIILPKVRLDGATA